MSDRPLPTLRPPLGRQLAPQVTTPRLYTMRKGVYDMTIKLTLALILIGIAMLGLSLEPPDCGTAGPQEQSSVVDDGCPF